VTGTFLVAKGVDLVVSPTESLFGVAGRYWNTEFWNCVSNEFVPGSQQEATIPMCLEYTRLEVRNRMLNEGYTEEEADSVMSMGLFEGEGLDAKDYRLSPARYGRSTN